jgi:hypothetical protein
MTPEQIEKTIDFILRHEAQLVMTEEKLADDLQNLSGTVQTLAGATLALADNAERDREHLQRLDQIIENDRKRLDRLEGSS